MGTRARRRETDSAARVRALTRRAYLASAGHLDLDDDPPAAAPGEFEQILRGPDEPSVSRPRVRWKVSVRAAVAAVLVLGVLTGIILVRSVVAGGSPAVPLPSPPSAGSEPVDGTGPDPPTVPPADPADGSAAAVEPDTAAPGEQQETAPGPVLVHVAGAVQRPGVVTVPGGARVADVLEHAGGPTASAELGAINLARVVADGEQVYVPEIGQAEPGAQAGPAPVPGTPAEAGASGAVVDLNTADQAALETLPGVGPAIAQRILDWRQANGSFHAIDELQEVPGIGPATMERLRPLVTV